MKKEEILEASKKENKNKDYYEIQEAAKGANLAGVTIFLLFIYDGAKGNEINPAIYSIITTYNFMIFGYKALKIEKHRKLNVLTSIIWGVLTITLILKYFKVI